MEGEDKDWRRGSGTGKLRRLVVRAGVLEWETLDRVALRVVNMLESDSVSLALSTGERGNSNPSLDERGVCVSVGGFMPLLDGN